MTHLVRDDVPEDLRHIRAVLPPKHLNPVRVHGAQEIAVTGGPPVTISRSSIIPAAQVEHR